MTDMDSSPPEKPANIIIRASAGTGKTFQLSSRYLALLLKGCPADRILATTFTRKAAGEIVSRVLLRLASAAASELACNELSEAIGFPTNPTACQSLLQDVIRMLHRIRVGTLDSFFGQVAQSFSLEVGLPPRWQIADDVRHAALRQKSIEMLLGNDEPTAQEETPLALVHLLSKGEAKRGVNEMLLRTVHDAYSLFLESTRPAWHSLKRIPQINNDQLRLDLIEELRTYDFSRDALSSRQIAQLSEQCDATYDQTITEAWDVMLAKGIMKNVVLGKTTFNKIEIPPRLLVILQGLAEYLRYHFVNQTASITESSYRMLARFGANFEELKFREGSFLFDDMPRLLSRLEQDQRDSHLAFRIDGQIDHLLLDEFQDTSRIQWQALQSLAKQIVSDRSGNKSVFCVGDAKQAIYGWRGGMPEIFDRISNQLHLHDESLDTSYRSAQPIIDAVNQAFTEMLNHNNLGRLETGVRAWTKAFPVHTTARKSLVGYANMRTTDALAENEKASEVALRTAVDVATEQFRRCPGRSIGLLVRRNEMVSRAICQFRQQGFPASEEGGNPLTDSAAVLLICSALKLADHPGDTVAAFHVGHSDLAQDLGLDPNLDQRSPQYLRAAATIRQQLLTRGYGQCIDHWSQRLRHRCNDREWNRVRQLVTLAYRHETTLLPREFLARVETEKVADPTSAPIRVMTVHQSKGLQFDIVVLGELEFEINPRLSFVAQHDHQTFEVQRVCRYVGEGIRALLPNTFQNMHDDSVTRVVREELCLLYVAMTRAKHALHMVVAPTVGERTARTSSRTYAGLLRAGLCNNHPLDPRSIPFEIGDPEWHAKSSRPTRMAVACPPQHAAHAEPTRMPVATVNAAHPRRLRHISPSQLEGGNQARLRTRLSQRSDAMLLGTLFHACLEQIQWIEEGIPQESEFRRIAARLGITDNVASKAHQQFHRAIAAEAVQSILRRSSYMRDLRHRWTEFTHLDIDVRNEQRILVRRDHALLGGSVDRLVVVRREDAIVAADIIDFKTDRFGESDPRHSSLADRVAYYRPQMEAYRDAIQRMLKIPVDRIAVRLAFVLENHLVDIPCATPSDSVPGNRPAPQRSNAASADQPPTKSRAPRQLKLF